MEVARLRSGPTVRFFGGVVTMILANVLGGFIGGYIIALFRVGPYLPWVPIDKNIGLEKNSGKALAVWRRKNRGDPGDFR